MAGPQLTTWLKRIDEDKNEFKSFYEAMLHQKVSDTEMLFWCIEAYGKWPTFEAIIAAKKKRDMIDALPYILTVAQAKWKDSHLQMSEDGKYDRGIQRTKRRTREQNEELEELLRKAKGQ